MLGVIDRYKKPEKSRLFLCKPNRQTLAELKEAYGKELRTSYNGIHELTFTIPYKIIKNNKSVNNPNFHLIKGDYLIKYVKGDIEEYFVIDKPSNTGGEKDNKTVTCFLSPYALRKKLVRNYSGTKKLYDPVGSDGFLNDTLIRKTNWSVGYVDGDLLTKYRTVDVTEQSLIEFIESLNEAFGCIAVWDTKNKQLHLYKDENYGTDKGLLVEQGKYLKAISEEPDFDSVATRVYVYGKEDLTFNSVNPSGTDYIESFDYYLYPFERDVNKNTIKSSNYMSDGLCHALLDYTALVESKQGEFANLLTQKESLQQTLTTKQNELTNLEIDLAIIQDNIDVKMALEEDTSVLLVDKQNKEAEIATKKNEISTVKSDIANVDSQINTLKNTIAKENNFTPDQIVELNEYEHEKIINNQYISDEKELYNFAKSEIAKISQPLIHYKMDLVDFTKVVQCQRDWDKLNYGDIVTVRYPKFNVDIKARIISIAHNEDNNSIDIEIANSADINSGFLTLKDLFQKTTTSSTAIDMSKYKWDKSEANQDSINNIINSDFDAFSKRIIAGVDESVEISRRGIRVSNPSFPDDMTVIQAGAIGLIKNGEYKVAMHPDRGVVAEIVKGKLIAGVNLVIQNESGKYTMDDQGFTIQGGSFHMNDDGNGISITPSTGMTITSPTVRSTFNNTDGIKIQVKQGTNWLDKFYFDIYNSRLVVNGEINAAELKVNGSSVLTADKMKINGFYVDKITTDQLEAGTAKITSAMIETLEADKITGNKFIVGKNSTTTQLEMFTTDTGVHYIKSSRGGDNNVGGLRIESLGALSFTANSSYGVYIVGAPLVAQNGARFNGISQFNDPVTINSSLTTQTINCTSTSYNNFTGGILCDSFISAGGALSGYTVLADGAIDSGRMSSYGYFRYAGNTNSYLRVGSTSAHIYVGGSSKASWSSMPKTRLEPSGDGILDGKEFGANNPASMQPLLFDYFHNIVVDGTRLIFLDKKFIEFVSDYSVFISGGEGVWVSEKNLEWFNLSGTGTVSLFVMGIQKGKENIVGYNFVEKEDDGIIYRDFAERRINR